MTPILTRRYGHLAGVVFSIVLLACWGAAPAVAHLKDRSGNWYFGGGSYPDSSATGERLDPVNMLFYGGGRVTLERVTRHVADHTTLARLGKRRCLLPLGTGCFTKECNGGTQYMAFINHKVDRRAGAPRRSITGHAMDLESACSGTRYHIRLWTDWAHDEATEHHRVKDWIVGTFHKDIDRDGEHIPGSWEANETLFVRSMDRKHCVRKDWRFHAGAYKKGGTWRGRTNNGMISLVTFAHNGEDTCAAETG